MLTPRVPAPEDYYQNNCCLLFRFVLERYGDLLCPEERTQFEKYLSLSNDAQRLVARLLTRKGPQFRVDLLAYREIDDLGEAIEELESSGLLSRNPQVSADALLHLLRKDELVTFWCQSKSRAASEIRKLRKDELVTHLASRYTDRQIRDRLYADYTLIALQNPEVWELAKLLYFGEARSDWSTFVLNDLGRIRYEDVDISTRQFENRNDLERYLSLMTLSRLSHNLAEHEQLAGVLAEHLIRVQGDRFVARRRDRALLRVARHLEKSQRAQEALSTYGSVQRHPARERSIRLLHRSGRTDEAEALLSSARHDPYSEEESQFCERFRQRRAGFQPETFTVEFDSIDAEERIETQALRYLAEHRGLSMGAHVENVFVRSLTGLVYWPVIYQDIPGAFTNPFQSGPNDLYLEDFVDVRRAALEQLESELSAPGALQAHIRSTIDEKFNVANSLVSWSMFDVIDVEEMLDVIPEEDIRRLTSFQIRRLTQFRTGLPDLLVFYPDGGYELIEVKGPNDQLQPVQRLWFKHFDRMGIPARVMKIRLASV